MRTFERDNSAQTSISREGEAGGTPGTGESPAAHGAEHGEAAVLLQPTETHRDAEIPLHTRAGG